MKIFPFIINIHHTFSFYPLYKGNSASVDSVVDMRVIAGDKRRSFIYAIHKTTTTPAYPQHYPPQRFPLYIKANPRKVVDVVVNLKHLFLL